MTDKKLTDNEIIKALVDAVICVGRAPFVEKQRKGEELKQNILDLINRQDEELNRLQAENERLRKRLDLSVGMDNTKNNGCFPFD